MEQKYGGEGGIRTHGPRKGSTVFETARFNHSRTSPDLNCLIFLGLRPLATTILSFFLWTRHRRSSLFHLSRGNDRDGCVLAAQLMAADNHLPQTTMAWS